MRAPKRRRSVGVDTQHVPPVGGSGVEQGSLDDLELISRLPDEVLGTVISLLPTKDGARTQALSRRWLPLWPSDMAPLNLVADRNFSNEETRASLVSKILSDHPGPARRFTLHFSFFAEPLDEWFPSKELTSWFRSETLTGLQELEVTNLMWTCYQLPPHALIRFAPTLRVLSLGGCGSPDLVAPPSFPHLKQLILYEARISEDSLESMISSCCVLESILLQKMGFGRLCIRSPTLRSINLCGLRLKCELVIEDAPCLERLLPFFTRYGPAIIRVIRAPKLEILGFLSKSISTLHLGTTVFQKMIAVSLTTKMHSMKILALDSTGGNLDVVVDFLKCFPSLEKIYVILDPAKDIYHVQNYDPIECVELHLKKVVLKNYRANKASSIDFAKFFILNAKVLKEMEIKVFNGKGKCDKWISCQNRQLQVENRASRDAQFELRYGEARPMCNVTDDLSTADPFEYLIV